jgi:hypothetical protein
VIDQSVIGNRRSGIRSPAMTGLGAANGWAGAGLFMLLIVLVLILVATWIRMR